MQLGKKNEYLADFVYGGIDGAITTLAIISGAIGASLSPAIIIILGLANLSADGFSMGISNYLSVKSQNDLNIKNKEISNSRNPIKSAIITFFAFVLIGFIPLIPFLFSKIIPTFQSNQAFFAFFFTSIAFLIIGSIRGSLTGKNRLFTSLTTFAIGTTAATIAFLVGYTLSIWLL